MVDISAGNGTTGFNSVNRNTVNLTDNSTTSLTNVAAISNAFNVTANTGGNDTNQNTTVGNVSTGGATINFSATNQAN
jgi:hypothetical protein